MNHQQQPSFEFVEDESKKKYLFIGLGVLLLLLILGALYFFVFSSEEPGPVNPPTQARVAQPAAQTQSPAPQSVQVVAKDPARQGEVDQQVEKLRHFIQNPTSDDANIAVGWLVNKYNQPAEVIVKDIRVLTKRLSALSDEDLAAFFAGPENPWRDDPNFNNLIKIVSHREYVSFIDKCADRYSREKLGQN